MNQQIIKLIADELQLLERQVESTVELLNDGATVPFIARYRKELTGSLDEVHILNIKLRKDKLEELENRKKTILSTIEEQGKLTPELKARIEQSHQSTELEDLYLPYKPKRRTRATIAREKGLEPLAKIIMKQREEDPDRRAGQFSNNDVRNIDEAVGGARDIIAEWMSENEAMRNNIRRLFGRSAILKCKVVKGKEEEGIKYKDYFDWEEPLKRCPSHRFMAMKRGEKEGILKLTVLPDQKEAFERITRFFVRSNNASSEQVEIAAKDAYKRLLSPSIENEFVHLSKDKSDEEAIKVFAENLRQLLLAAPLGQKRILALDPGYRTGCKLVCLDEQGNLLHNETIFPHPPQMKVSQSKKSIAGLVDAYKIEAIAIGNGTASRETEAFVRGMNLGDDVKIFVVSEDGASVYSASEVAREEFPQYDVTVRGAISIGRRLMDPLAELVKIDPKSIGVGQYQHDVDQKSLKNSLDSVVESCVNLVGVNVNTASEHLLRYVSGLGPQLARNIVEYRKKYGMFRSRKELKDVPKLGAKTFEQCAGFLRIPGAKNPLDNSAVHPESYAIVKKMAKSLDCKTKDLVKSENLRKQIHLEDFVTEEAGMPTLTDIMNELTKPGRDPREEIHTFEFAEGIYTIEDLMVGMVVPGLVTNITRFGAFVDIGVKQDGLVHISEMANKFISDPTDVVKLQQEVQVKVIEVDLKRKRIQLSMKQVEH